MKLNDGMLTPRSGVTAILRTITGNGMSLKWILRRLNLLPANITSLKTQSKMPGSFSRECRTTRNSLTRSSSILQQRGKYCKIAMTSVVPQASDHSNSIDHSYLQSPHCCLIFMPPSNQRQGHPQSATIIPIDDMGFGCQRNHLSLTEQLTERHWQKISLC